MDFADLRKKVGEIHELPLNILNLIFHQIISLYQTYSKLFT